jgi:hypothetical protein
MQVNPPLFHAAKWIVIGLAIVIGSTFTAFPRRQAVVADSLVKVVERGDLATLRTRLSSGANPKRTLRVLESKAGLRL